MRTVPTDINTYAKEIYTDNKEKGFWDAPVDPVKKVVLIQSEMFEALEAHRKGRLSGDGIGAEALINDPEAFVMYFEAHIKDSLQDELADVMIRILDMAGGYSVPIHYNYITTSLLFWDDKYSSMGLMKREHYSFPSCVLEFGNLVNTYMQQDLASPATHKVMEKGLNLFFEFTCSLSQHVHADLWLHVKLKLAYNRSRAFRHGKKY